MRLILAALVGLLVSVAPRAQATDPLPTALQQIRATSGVPAVGGVLFTSTSIGVEAVAGVRKQGDVTAVATGDLWHIGSLTKSFTSTLLGKFVEKGDLQWTSTLGEVIGVERAGKFAPVTLAQVLSHRAGLAANPANTEMVAALQSREPLPTQRRVVIDKALSAEPLSAPGSTFLYSNLDYILIGHILETKSGRSWEDLVRAEVLAPLKLTSAGFGAPGIAGTLSQPRGHRAQGSTLVPMEPGPFADNPPMLGPAGTLHMSVADLARWGQEHLRGERGVDGLLKAATYQTIHTPPVAGADYAFGWVVQEWNGRRVVWHNGSNTMWYAVVAFDAAADRGVVLVTNGSINARVAIDAAAKDLLAASSAKTASEPALPSGAVYSGDRSHIAYLANGTTPAMSSRVDIHVRRLADGVDRRVATFDGVVNALTFSTDGTRLLFKTAFADERTRDCEVWIDGRSDVSCR